jgi:hypothetical protein
LRLWLWFRLLRQRRHDIGVLTYRQPGWCDERCLTLYALHVARNTEMPAFGTIIIAIDGVESA